MFNESAERHSTIPREAGSPPALEELQHFTTFQESNAHIFGSTGSLTWFIRQNRAELLDAGALVQIAGRCLIHGPLFTVKAMEIGRRTAAARHVQS